MVWEFVFGGYQIYVYPREMLISIVHGIPTTINSGVLLEFRSGDKMTLDQKTRHQPTLKLMTVCRQMYMGAVLLPFKLNMWHIDSSCLRDFISSQED